MYIYIFMKEGERENDMGIHGAFLTQVIIMGVLCVVDMRYSCMYCVPWTSAIISNPSTRAITDHCRSANGTDTYFKSRVYVEDLGPPGVDGISTHNLSIDSLYLTNGTAPLIPNLKAFNFMQWIVNHFKIISSNQPFQIPRVYITLLVCNATSQQLLSWESTRKSWSHVFCQQRVIIALTAWWPLDYVMLKKA